MYGLSNGENILDFRWPSKVEGQGRTPQKIQEHSFQSTIDIHIQNPHKNSGWSLAGCIGCCNMLSAATKLRRLALCAFIVIHSTMAFRKLTWTKYSAYKILWLVSLLIHQNLNTLHQYSKNYIGFQSNNASITNCVFLHIKHFKFSNLYLSLQ